MREEVGKRQPPVPGERPGLSGRGGEEAERGADYKGDEHGGQDGGAGVRVRGAEEDLDEVESRRAGEVGFQVAEREAEGDVDGEA